MKKYVITILILLSTICLTDRVQGQNLFPLLGGQRIGTAAANFLKIGVGARATSMSGAAVAMANDATALYWNPGAAAQVKGNAVAISHIDWPVDIKYEYLSYIHHIKNIGIIGFSGGYLYTDDMEVTTEYHPTGTGEYFSYYDTFGALSFAIKMTDRFSFGTSLKFVEENLAGLKMGGWLIDLGTFYWTGFRSLRFAVSLVNFGPDLRPAGSYMQETQEGGMQENRYEAFSPPTMFRVGSAMEIIERKNYTVTTSLQINHPVDNAENAVVGMEFGYLDNLFLRAGYRINYAEEKFTFGAGFNVPFAGTDLLIDYAFKQFRNLGVTNQFTLGYHF